MTVVAVKDQSKTTYRKMAEGVMRDLQSALSQRYELDARISGLIKTARELFSLAGMKHPAILRMRPRGRSGEVLTKEIRRLLEEHGHLKPTELRDLLAAGGVVNLKKYPHPLVVIHNTLLRLKRQGEVVVTANAAKGAAYRKVR